MLVPKTLDSFRYWEMLKGEVTAETPITLLLHYMTGDAFALGFLFDNFERPMRVLSLQADYPSGDPLGGYSWYTGEEDFYAQDEVEQAVEIRQRAGEIALFIEAIKRQYPAAKIAVIGMSQGGDLTLSLAAYHPHLFDLAIPCAGRLSAPMRPDVPLRGDLPRVHLKHGEKDPIVPVDAAYEAAAWLNTAGYVCSLEIDSSAEHDLSPLMVRAIQWHLREEL